VKVTVSAVLPVQFRLAGQAGIASSLDIFYARNAVLGKKTIACCVRARFRLPVAAQPGKPGASSCDRLRETVSIVMIPRLRRHSDAKITTG
jgi:hypothetical protein